MATPLHSEATMDTAQLDREADRQMTSQDAVEITGISLHCPKCGCCAVFDADGKRTCSMCKHEWPITQETK